MHRIHISYAEFRYLLHWRARVTRENTRLYIHFCTFIILDRRSEHIRLYKIHKSFANAFFILVKHDASEEEE